MQKVAFKKTIDKINNKESIKMGKIMQDSGYSELTSKNPEHNLISKDGWKQQLEEIDDSRILKRFNEIVDVGKDRDSISAGKELLTLKNRYPDKHLRINSLKTTISDVLLSE